MTRKLFLLVLFVTTLTFAQNEPHRTCGTKAFMAEQMQDPEFAQRHTQIQQAFINALNSENTIFANQTYVIPVAVHFPAGNEANRACLVSLAQSQVDILNNDFQGSNADISNWTAASTHYPGVNTGAMSIRFEIATQNHPANTDNDLVEGQPAVTIGYNFGGGNDSDTAWAGYLNFIVKDIGAGLLGYSPLGGDPTQGASVVMNITAFGSGAGCPGGYTPGAPFNLGRTVTHELGHHFNLDHTWGNGGCGSDDGVADTPNIDQASYNCPAAGSVTMCGNKSLTMNFMDYVNDSCMYMFTQGQIQRATTYVNTIYSHYNQNVLSVEDFSADRFFSIYPNPAGIDDVVNIRLKSTSTEDIDVLIYDITGKVVKNAKLKKGELSGTVNVSGLSSGMYFMNMKTSKLKATRKLVIK